MAENHMCKSKTVTVTLMFWLLLFTCTQAFSQDSRALSQSVQDRIERLEELAGYYINQEDHKAAISYLNQISYIYWENHLHERAAESFQRTIPFYERINDLENLQKLYSNIGLIYLDIEDVALADQAFTKNLEIARQLGERKGIAIALVDLAYVKNLRNDYREANRLLEEAMEIAIAINYESILPNIYKQLSNSYTNVGNTRQGETYRQKYTDIREHLGRQAMMGEFEEREQQSQVEILRSQAEARARKAELELQEILFQHEQDSVRLVVRQREDSLELSRLRSERQLVEIERMEQEAELTHAEIERQRAVQNFQQLVIYSVLGGLALVLILAVFMFRSNKAKQRANKALAAKNIEIEQTNDKLQVAFEKIEDQNFRITQSITYAREIQRALFPPIETLNHFLPESFIFFKPVDLVSGDFYWFSEVNINVPRHKELQAVEAQGEKTTEHHENGAWLPFSGEKFIISAVDCTGHGVPGAFMSMIGYNLLDSITNTGTTAPDKILSKLHNGVRTALKQDETTNRDGMDISLCTINKKDRTVDFAGANNPVIYITEGEMHMIKGDMMAIGGSHKKTDRTYKGHTIKVEKPTTFYILTDGYTDQFGGEDGRKYSMKNFKQLLMEIYQLPMQEQNKILGEHFEQWKADEHQIDDVLVIGFRLQ